MDSTQFLFNCLVPGHEKIFRTLTFLNHNGCGIVRNDFPSATGTNFGDYRKSHSVEADETILIFDGQNMMHWMRTDSLLLCAVFHCIFITIACYLTQIHKKYANLLISFVTMSINNDLQKTEFFHLNNLFVRVFSAAFCEVRETWLEIDELNCKS